jgi:hypothetical protein
MWQIGTDRLDGEHLERPVAGEADVAEAGRHVHEQPQPADRAAALDHRHQVVGLGSLHRPAEIELVGGEHEAVLGNRDPLHPVALPHVEHHLLVDEQLVVEREVVAVGVEAGLVEGVDEDVAAEAAADLVAGEDHDGLPDGDDAGTTALDTSLCRAIET